MGHDTDLAKLLGLDLYNQIFSVTWSDRFKK